MTDQIKRPAFVVVFVLLTAAQACVLLLPIYIAIFATPDSTFQLTGDSMLMEDVRFELLAVLLIWQVVTVYVGLGLWRGNSIARHVFFCLLVVVLLVETFARQRFIELPLVAIMSGLVAWYLYAKPNVKLFFEAT